MSDFAILAGVNDTVSSSSFDLNTYYLQQMEIDVWKLRSLDSHKKPLILFASSNNLAEMNKEERALFKNMLSSINLCLDDLVVKIVSDDLEKDCLLRESNILRTTSFILVVGGSLWDWFTDKVKIVGNKQYLYNNLNIFFVFHPSYLLANPICKKEAYQQLLSIDFIR
ncbi:MAG: hypothetical protein A3E88_05740 [Legionellales bacterium RIFCSPHIGHO2_12_FULL_35_11]|nr:MAG: hypothetical protein A3E88_05740 [Legionellales bacterium RIFCSPHIGHO2_12_FULL_35_11]